MNERITTVKNVERKYWPKNDTDFIYFQLTILKKKPRDKNVLGTFYVLSAYKQQFRLSASS